MYIISFPSLSPNPIILYPRFRLRKVRRVQGHMALGSSSIQALITKLPAQIPKMGCEHLSRRGTVYRLSLYHWHMTETYLREALLCGPLLPVTAKAALKHEADFLEVWEWIPIST